MPTKEYRDCFIHSINGMNTEMINLLSERPDNFSSLARHFHAFVHERINSLLVLVQNDCLWDADVILRSIAEASVKLVYLLCFNAEERDKKVSEFWNELAEINRLKQSKQAREILEKLNLNAKSISDLIMSESEEKILSEKWTKSNRQRIEQPWAYNEMIKVIAKESNKEKILCLSRNFTQSSHIIHADETALGVIWDREQRTNEEKEKQMNLHEIRLFSDCLSFYAWTLDSLLAVFNEKPKKSIELIISDFIEMTRIIEGKINLQ